MDGTRTDELRNALCLLRALDSVCLLLADTFDVDCIVYAP